MFAFQFWQLWDIYALTIEPWLDDANESADLIMVLVCDYFERGNTCLFLNIPNSKFGAILLLHK